MTVAMEVTSRLYFFWMKIPPSPGSGSGTGLEGSPIFVKQLVDIQQVNDRDPFPSHLYDDAMKREVAHGQPFRKSGRDELAVDRIAQAGNSAADIDKCPDLAFRRRDFS